MWPGCQRQVAEASSRGRNAFAAEIAAQFGWAERSRPCLECGDPWIERPGAARRAIGPVRCGTDEERWLKGQRSEQELQRRGEREAMDGWMVDVDCVGEFE